MTDARDAALAYLRLHAALGPRRIVLPAAPGGPGAPTGGLVHDAVTDHAPEGRGADPSPDRGSATDHPSNRRGAADRSPARDAPADAPPSGDEASRAPHLADLPDGLAVEPPAVDLFSSDPVLRADSLGTIAELVARCTRCPLHQSRTQGVPGEGPATARLVVVGEGPGRREDETGRPFVGQAGELLTRILAAIDLPREDVFICNVVKSRPPNNRVPNDEEIQACVPYLYRQLELIAPRVILAMGGTAATTLLQTRVSLGQLRGKIHRFRGTPLVVTYHPAALLRNPHWKRPTWDDVRIARQLLDD